MSKLANSPPQGNKPVPTAPPPPPWWRHWIWLIAAALSFGASAPPLASWSPPVPLPRSRSPPLSAFLSLLPLSRVITQTGRAVARVCD